VENPSVIWKAIKRSISEIPITISALSMGILVSPIKTVRDFFFIPCMPMAARVPSMVAIRAESRAMISVVYRAFMIWLFWKSDLYQSMVNPPHFALVLEALKDRTMSVTIGA